jgi:predicted dienelactone hydrolase
MTVGVTSLEVVDPLRSGAVPVWALYPAQAAERVERFGPYELALARDAEPAGGGHGVVVVSHGREGSPFTHRDLACALVRAGHVVLLVEHVGNSRSDKSLTDTIEGLVARPRQAKLALDALVAHPILGAVVRPRVAMIGHSIGGYTALALAGGEPWCTPRESPDGIARPVEVAHDDRVVALVLLAPATVWFVPDGSLSRVTAPMLLLSGERDDLAPSFHADIVLEGVPDRSRIVRRVVPGAGHFSFQSPFPASMARPDFPPSQDPEGFDRRAYMPELEADVIAFVARHLG